MALPPRRRANRLFCICWISVVFLGCVLAATASVDRGNRDGSPVALRPARRGNNWAVILSGSSSFFNYRHTSTGLMVYKVLRDYGFDDDHILLFIGDIFACDSRNPYPAEIFTSVSISSRQSMYSCNTQVDFSNSDMTVEEFLKVLEGRYDSSTPASRRLLSDENSNILIYMGGHGAQHYFKFMDYEYLSADDLADVFATMHTQRRYKKILFLVDTCKALSLCQSIRSPNVVCLASAKEDEDSYSMNMDFTIGMTLSSIWVHDWVNSLKGTSCSDPSKGLKMPSLGSPRFGVSVLHHSLYEFLFNPLNGVDEKKSSWGYRDAVNNTGAIRLWTVAEFFCPMQPSISEVAVRYDLF